MQRHWDIFCRVIDNFGDIGVCWRLARQLSAEHGLAVRLWLDEPNVLAGLCPDFDAGMEAQTVAGVEVRHWRDPFPETEAADVVVEAFACELPAGYLQAMVRRARAPRWINLEYLSAESWVEGCHGLASPHPGQPLVKHFFFPGFTPRTGGLLRESGLLERRDAFMRSLPRTEALQISLFCYDSAPVGALLDAWAGGDRAVRCLVPPGKPLDAVRRHLGSARRQQGNLEVVPIPFVPQAQFDHLLWRCDINLVRGEDSFVRAQWAGKPFVWHIYPQQDEAHLVKLEAFLDIYTAGLPSAAAAATKTFFHAWNGDGNGLEEAWKAFLGQRPALDKHGLDWANILGGQEDLAARLVKFCNARI